MFEIFNNPAMDDIYQFNAQQLIDQMHEQTQRDIREMQEAHQRNMDLIRQIQANVISEDSDDKFDETMDYINRLTANIREDAKKVEDKTAADRLLFGLR